MTKEEESLRDAKAKAYETVIGALNHIRDCCDLDFCDKAGIKKFAEKKIKKAEEAFKEHLRKFPD